MQGLHRFGKKISQTVMAWPEGLRILIFTMGMGFLTHGFVYANTLFAHDNTRPFNDAFSALRWSSPFFYAPRAFLQMPWVIGLITLAELSAVVYLLARSLSIRHVLGQFLLSAVVITFPSVICFHNYGNVDLYTGPLLLSIAAAVLANRKGFWNALFAVLLLCLSLGTYQAFVSMTASLMLLFLLRDMLIRRSTARLAVRKGLKFIAVLAASVILSYLVYRIFSHFSDASGVTGYRSEDQLGHFSPAELLQWLWETYKTVFYYMIPTSHSLYPFPIWVMGMQWVCILAVGIASVLRLIREGFFRHPAGVCLSLALLLLLPAAINLIQLLNNGYQPHLLMMFAFITPWLLVLQYGEWALRQLPEVSHPSRIPLKRCLAGLCAVLICVSSYYGYVVANADYLSRKLNYDASLSLATRILGKIEAIDGFTKATPVIFIGDVYSSGDANPRDGFEICHTMMAGLSRDGQAMTYNDSLGSTVEWFINGILSAGMNIVDCSQIAHYTELAAGQSVPAFPQNGCYFWADGVLVFKLS